MPRIEAGCDEYGRTRKERKSAEVRQERDRLLAATDYLLAADYPITAESLEAVKTYRQALRDVPEQETFPEEVAWPEKPAVQKKEGAA